MSLRVFVNERPVTVARGATVRDAVAALDGELAGLLASGAAYATDGVGRPVDAAAPIGEGGAIPLCNVLAGTYPDAELILMGVEEPLALIHAPNESVDPAEIAAMALTEALFLQRYAAIRR